MSKIEIEKIMAEIVKVIYPCKKNISGEFLKKVVV